MNEVDALCNFRLAPLKTRRDIAILGMLHRVNLGQVSPQMADFFEPIGERPVLGDFVAARVRGATAFHNRQLRDRITANSSEQIKRSILGMVQCYNALPQQFVDAKSVSLFQRQLQVVVTKRVRDGFDNWQSLFSDGKRYSSLLRFQSYLSTL